jgi:hypothetical protein
MNLIMNSTYGNEEISDHMHMSVVLGYMLALSHQRVRDGEL